jgi:hypothetical protein
MSGMPSTGVYGHGSSPVSVSPVVDVSPTVVSALVVVGDVVIDVVASVVIVVVVGLDVDDIVLPSVLVVAESVPDPPVSSFGQAMMKSESGSQARFMTSLQAKGAARTLATAR